VEVEVGSEVLRRHDQVFGESEDEKHLWSV
jgi:hypothetical protein